MNIGTKIKILRESNRLSQNELSEKLEISQSQLCKIESGVVEKIDIMMMNKICYFFGVDFQYFLKDSFSQTKQENVIESIIKNQEQITKLLEAQNTLLDGLKTGLIIP